MAKYINRDALIEWLKRIPLKDLSDGLGLCRVIMEDDFKKAIKNIPKGVIVDAVPVVRCKDCKYFKTRLCENDDAPVRHGRWRTNVLYGYEYTFVCSECGYVDVYPFDGRHRYCPNCGAKMDEKE